MIVQRLTTLLVLYLAFLGIGYILSTFKSNTKRNSILDNDGPFGITLAWVTTSLLYLAAGNLFVPEAVALRLTLFFFALLGWLKLVYDYRNGRKQETTDFILSSIWPLLLTTLMFSDFFSSHLHFYWGGANVDFADGINGRDVFLRDGTPQLLQFAEWDIAQQYSLPALFSQLNGMIENWDSAFYTVYWGVFSLAGVLRLLIIHINRLLQVNLPLVPVLALSLFTPLYANTYFTGHIGSILVTGVIGYLYLCLSRFSLRNCVYAAIFIFFVLFCYIHAFIFIASGVFVPCVALLPMIKNSYQKHISPKKWPTKTVLWVCGTIILLVVGALVYKFIYAHTEPYRLLAMSKYRAWQVSRTVEMFPIWFGITPPLSITGYLDLFRQWSPTQETIYGLCTFVGIGFCLSVYYFINLVSQKSFSVFSHVFILFSGWAAATFLVYDCITDPYFLYKLLYIPQPFIVLMAIAGYFIALKKKNIFYKVLAVALILITTTFTFAWNIQNFIGMKTFQLNRPNAFPTKEQLRKFASDGVVVFISHPYEQFEEALSHVFRWTLPDDDKTFIRASYYGNPATASRAMKKATHTIHLNPVNGMHPYSMVPFDFKQPPIWSGSVFEIRKKDPGFPYVMMKTEGTSFFIPEKRRSKTLGPLMWFENILYLSVVSEGMGRDDSKKGEVSFDLLLGPGRVADSASVEYIDDDVGRIVALVKQRLEYCLSFSQSVMKQVNKCNCHQIFDIVSPLATEELTPMKIINYIRWTIEPDKPLKICATDRDKVVHRKTIYEISGNVHRAGLSLSKSTTSGLKREIKAGETIRIEAKMSFDENGFGVLRIEVPGKVNGLSGIFDTRRLGTRIENIRFSPVLTNP